METQAQGKFNGGVCVPFFPTSAVFFTFFSSVFFYCSGIAFCIAYALSERELLERERESARARERERGRHVHGKSGREGCAGDKIL
jgi:hypothetical protein